MNKSVHITLSFNQRGFTLYEMLIVIIVLGGLAMIIIPQISVSTEDAKTSTLQTNLRFLRSAIRLYYVQHEQKYPGQIKSDGSGDTATDAESATAFVDQLTKFSETGGKTNTDKTQLAGKVFGLYLKDGLPENPFIEASPAYTVAADYHGDKLRREASAPITAWKFYPKTGVLIANDCGASNDVNHDTY